MLEDWIENLISCKLASQLASCILILRTREELQVSWRGWEMQQWWRYIYYHVNELYQLESCMYASQLALLNKKVIFWKRNLLGIYWNITYASQLVLLNKKVIFWNRNLLKYYFSQSWSQSEKVIFFGRNISVILILLEIYSVNVTITFRKVKSNISQNSNLSSRPQLELAMK